MTPSLSERVRALQSEIAHWDHGEPAPLGVYHAALEAIAQRLDEIAAMLRDAYENRPDDSDIGPRSTCKGVAAELSSEGS